MPVVGDDDALPRRLGALGLGAAVFNTVVGAGIFVLPASLARDVGAAAPLAYLACVVGMGAVAVCFAAAGSRVATSGGPYGYARAAFGPLIGFIVGVMVWLGAVLAAAGIAAAVIDSLGRWWPVLAQAPARIAALASLFAALAAVNIAGVSPGTRLVGALTVAKLVPLALLLIVGLTHVHPANLALTTPSAGAFGRAMILALFAFQGMETALGVSGEVKTPARNVPLGLLGAMAAIACLYVGVQVAAQGVLGPALAQTHAPLVQAVAAVAPSFAAVMVAGATVSMLGYLASDVLSAPRLLFSFARAGLAPRALGQLTSRTRAPARAIILHAGLAAVLAMSGGFTELAILSSLTTLIVYVVGCAAAWRLQIREVAREGAPLRVHNIALVAGVGIASMFWIATHATPEEALGCAASVVLAAAWYGVARARSPERRPS